MTRGFWITAMGFLLTSVTYGLARMSLGQFLPFIREDLALSEGMAGLLSSGLFVGNCVSLTIAAFLTRWAGPRATATLAGICATTGLVGVAFAQSDLQFAIAMLLAGSAAGLTLPPVVTAICAEVVKGRRALATTVVNAGTSAGIVASAPLALLAYGDWRVAYLLFALVAGITTLGIFAATPAIVSARGVSSQKARVSLRVFWEAPRVRALLISAFLCGIVLAPYWTFGGEILAQQAGWSGEEIGFLWMVLGAAGLFGAVSGALVRRFGVGKVHDASFVLMSASLFLLMLSPINPWFPLIGAALQSSSYMSLSGAYLVWGVDDVPKDPAGITAATFFMMPLGLALGAYVFGHGLAMFGAGPMLWLFGLFTLSGLLLYQHDRSFLASVPA